MKVSIQQFLARNHSWSIVGQNISRSLISSGHQVDLFSTNGNDNFPSDLLPNLIGYGEGMKISSGRMPSSDDYDLSLSYTAPLNFKNYLRYSKRNRFGIYCYEFANKNSLPSGFAKQHIFCDKILAPSSFAKQVFLDSGVPDNKVEVVSHGINLLEINQAALYPLKTKKAIKILMNFGQIHKRKNITGALEMIGKAFSKKDDVCVVLKVQDRKPTQPFELSFSDLYRRFEDKFPNHCEFEIIRNFIPNIYSIYKSCDITFSPSFCEGFGLVPLEGLACGLIPIASNYGGFLDFLNKENSLLIDGKEFNVPPDFLYYQSKTGTTAFRPDLDHGVEQLKFAVSNFEELKNIAIKNIPQVMERFSWNKITEQILSLVK